MHIWINGDFIEASNAKIGIAEGYSFGYGLFETIKVQNSKMAFWSEHMDRLSNGLELIGMDGNFKSDELLEKAAQLIARNRLGGGALKVTISKRGDSRDIVLSTRTAEYPESLYEKGFELRLSDSRRNQYSIIPYVKSLNYMENIIERKKSTERGFDDCIFLNTDGHVAETSISNVFFSDGEKLYTPRIESGILNGIVRSKVIDAAKMLGIEPLEGDYSLEELNGAKEVFLTNSLMGIMPVSAIEDTVFEAHRRDITIKIQNKYGEMLNAEFGL